ncbi:MAG: drug/metabolite transporter (DMT)-like permease [Saprospiraceae bacterium]|jgi:drug/metabolite transporter (DMT)-like permease
MSNNKRPYIELHIAVLLYGLTAVLGDLIQLPAVILVWWRVLITSFSLLFFIRFGRDLLTVKRSVATPIMLIGCIVAVHWICFYGSIKLANASVALVCMATTTIFTSFLEPWIMKKRIDPLETLLGLLIVPGMVLVVNSIGVSMRNGVLVGIASAFFAALFGTLNKKYVLTTTPYIFTFLQLGSAWIFISLLFIFGGSYLNVSQFFPPSTSDWIYVIILALLCTTLAYILNLRALKTLSAYATNLVINLEPLYGIVLAAAILKEYEQLTTNFYIGGGIILAIVMSYPYLKKRFSPTI